MRKLGILFAVILILVSIQTGSKVNAAGGSVTPIKVAILYDSTNSDTNLTSTLYAYVTRLLKGNKIPFDSLDITGNNHPSLQDASGNLNYSAVVIEALGTALDATNSQNILNAVNSGMGAVAVLPGTVNSILAPAFGIAVIGSQQKSADSFSFIKDKFTFAYVGTPVNQVSYYLNHTLTTGADIVAQFPDNQPAIWTDNYGSGTTVYHNTTATNTMSYWGILVQSILYAMPMGVASPANVMALNVDDCPMTYYTPYDLQSYYYDFMTNYLRWLSAYQVKSTFYVSFSYSGNIADFWTNPQPLQAAADILSSGNELGLHNGSLHLPLDPLYWGSSANVDSEVSTINNAIQTLRQKLLTDYNIILPQITSYVAPGNCITAYGYQTLNNNTTIKYVGEAFAPSSVASGLTPANVAPALASSVFPDTIVNFLNSTDNKAEQQVVGSISNKQTTDQSSPKIQAAAAPTQYTLTTSVSPTGSGNITISPNQANYNAGTTVNLTAVSAAGWIFSSWSGSNDLSSAAANPTTITMNANETVVANFTYPQVTKDFGQEGNYSLFNLPRIQSGFEIFNHPEYTGYTTYLNIGRTLIESGQPYILYTHPDEGDLTDKTLFPDSSEATVFNGMSAWANYIATNYPFYRWMTSTQTGDFLSSRTGTLSAEWNAASNTLQLTMAQPDDPIHIKTAKYLNSITGSGSNLTLTFVDTPNNFQSSQYYIVRIAHDYFIYPLGQNSLIPQVPSQPFVFQSVSQPGAPVLNPIGNKQAVLGQPLTFTVSAVDPNGLTLTYSASNLPAGAVFNATTQVFSWTPATVGTYSGIVFSVSNGNLTSSETIAINVTASAPGGEILKAIASGADDGFSGSWGFYNGLGWNEAGNPGSPYNVFLRFTGMTIPKGATITAAYLKIAGTRWDSGVNLLIKADKEASPLAPTSTAGQAALVRTTAGVAWTAGSADGTYHNSPDISAVIQELVNSFDYSGGSAIQILVDNNGSTAGSEGVTKTFESGTPPELDIVYQTGTQSSSAAEITAYSLPGQTGTAVINSAAGTIAVTMPSGTNVTALAASFTTSANIASIKIGTVTQVSGSTANNFTNPVTYAVTAQNGVTTKNWTVTVTLQSPPTGGEILKAITSGADDGFSGSWGFYNGLGWNEAGNPGSPYNVFLRFTGMAIPKGATITAAYLKIAGTRWDSGVNLLIKADKEASPLAPTSTAGQAALVRTTAGVAWTAGSADGTYHNSPDISAVIQELVNSFDYSGGSAIQILVDNNGSTAGSEGVTKTFESGTPVSLYIQWK